MCAQRAAKILPFQIILETHSLVNLVYLQGWVSGGSFVPLNDVFRMVKVKEMVKGCFYMPNRWKRVQFYTTTTIIFNSNSSASQLWYSTRHWMLEYSNNRLLESGLSWNLMNKLCTQNIDTYIFLPKYKYKLDLRLDWSSVNDFWHCYVFKYMHCTFSSLIFYRFPQFKPKK